MNIYDEIKSERIRQDSLWGGANHDDRHTTSDWANYIGDRVKKIQEGQSSLTTERMGELFLHIAALAVAALESIDRKA
jgi:hypothetical protein